MREVSESMCQMTSESVKHKMCMTKEYDQSKR